MFKPLIDDYLRRAADAPRTHELVVDSTHEAERMGYVTSRFRFRLEKIETDETGETDSLTPAREVHP